MCNIYIYIYIYILYIIYILGKKLKIGLFTYIKYNKVYLYTYIHTYTHTYTHMHICTCISLQYTCVSIHLQTSICTQNCSKWRAF